MVRTYLSEGDQLVLATVEVPQANDLIKLYKIPALIRDGITTPEEIARRLQIVEREGAYYLAAARAVRLVRKLPLDGAVFYALDYVGEAYLDARGTKKTAVMIRGTLDAPHVVYVAERLGLKTPLSTPTPRELHDVTAIERELASLGALIGETPRRRASTIMSWMKAVDRLARSIR